MNEHVLARIIADSPVSIEERKESAMLMCAARRMNPQQLVCPTGTTMMPYWIVVAAELIDFENQFKVLRAAARLA